MSSSSSNDRSSDVGGLDSDGVTVELTKRKNPILITKEITDHPSSSSSSSSSNHHNHHENQKKYVVVLIFSSSS